MTYPPGQDSIEVDDGHGGFIRITWYWAPSATNPQAGAFTDATAGAAMIIQNTTSRPVMVHVFYAGVTYTPTVPTGTTNVTARQLSRLNPALTDASQLQSVEVGIA